LQFLLCKTNLNMAIARSSVSPSWFAAAAACSNVGRSSSVRSATLPATSWLADTTMDMPRLRSNTPRALNELRALDTVLGFTDRA
jgi:hypothetical protein